MKPISKAAAAARFALWLLSPCPVALLTLVVGLEVLWFNDAATGVTDVDVQVAEAVAGYEPWQLESITATAAAMETAASSASTVGEKK